MELIGARTNVVPGASGRVRLIADISYDDRPGETEELWFELPESHANELSVSGNPWLVALLPLAAKLGEPIRIRLPVDRLLARNLGEMVEIWKCWHSGIHSVSIDADLTDDMPEIRGDKTAVFFSGGVDSLFVAFRGGNPESGSIPVDELLCVHGFDVPLADVEAFDRHGARMEAVAGALRKRLVRVVTNLRQTRLGTVPWEALGHACALGSVGLALERRFRFLEIASSADYGHLELWASHPVTDSLLSTASTTVLHEGATHNRCQKLEYLSQFEEALRALHVCYRDRSDRNCGHCEKCIRNMIILDVLGVLPRCHSFPMRTLNSSEIARLYLHKPWHHVTYGFISEFAASRGRDDIVAAIDLAFSRSRGARRLSAAAGWLSQNPLLRRAARPLDKWARAGRIV